MPDQNHDQEPHRRPKYIKGSATSEYAARSVDGTRRRKQALKILDLFMTGGSYTTDEVEVSLRLLHQSASARVSELASAGCIMLTGETRNTARGDTPAAVWTWVRGTSEDTFEAWLKRQRESLQTYKAWRLSFIAAGLVYAKSPTPANLTALGVAALAAPIGGPSPAVSLGEDGDVLDDDMF